MISWAYVDSSLVIAALFGEKLGPHKDIFKDGKRIKLISSYLLEAEVLSAVKREGADRDEAQRMLGGIGFIRTSGLSDELQQIFDLGYIRGADAFHLATALWVRDSYEKLGFLTLDAKQVEFARQLSFLE